MSKNKEVKVFQIQHIVTRVEDVQNHNVEQLEVILAKLKELNGGDE